MSKHKITLSTIYGEIIIKCPNDLTFIEMIKLI